VQVPSARIFRLVIHPKRVGLLQSPNLMIFALFLKYQTDSPRSGLESGIQIYLLGRDKSVKFMKNSLNSRVLKMLKIR
jgi:hypothetical protein